MTYQNQNLYKNSHFPDHWSSEDIEFLARFLESEFNAELVELRNPQRSYDYSLFVEERDDR